MAKFAKQAQWFFLFLNLTLSHLTFVKLKKQHIDYLLKFEYYQKVICLFKINFKTNSLLLIRRKGD